MPPVALIFEEENLLPFEVKQLIKRCLLELEDLVECTSEPDETFDSHFNRFLFNEDNDGYRNLSASFVKFGHMLRDLENRESIQIQFENFCNMNESSFNKACRWKKDLANRLMKTMWERFQLFENPLFEQIQKFGKMKESTEMDL